MSRNLYEIDFGNGYETVAPPVNYSAIKLDVAYDSNSASAVIQSVGLEFIGPTAQRINSYIAAGLTGGYGIYEGLPMRITTCEGTVYDLMLDLADESVEIECDRVVCPMTQAGKVDSVTDIAGSFTFSYLAAPDTLGKPGHINFSDYKLTPYCLYEQPAGTNISIMLLTVFTSAKTLVDLVSDISGAIADLAGIDPLHLASALIYLAALILYAVILISLLIKLIAEIFNAMISPKRYKLCMTERDLFKKGANYMGYNFVSTIYAKTSKYYNATWMPAKAFVPFTPTQTSAKNLILNPVGLYDSLVGFKRSPNEKGNTSCYGYFDGTFKEFMEEMMRKYNATIRISGKTMYFERWDKWNKTDAYEIPNTAEPGNTFNLPDPHGTNAADLPSVYYLKFQTDETDWNTIHFYGGTSVEAIVTHNVVKNQRYLRKTTGQIIEMSSALGKRKDFLTGFEGTLSKWFDPILPYYDMISKFIIQGAQLVGAPAPIINKIPSTLNLFGDRIGWLLLSNDAFSVPKSFIGVDDGNGDWEVAAESQAVMSAKGLFENFHGINLATRGGQYLVYKQKKFALCCKDVARLMENNVVKTSDGQYGKITKLVWNLEDQMVEEAEYRIQKDFTKNLKEKIIYDGVLEGVKI